MLKVRLLIEYLKSIISQACKMSLDLFSSIDFFFSKISIKRLSFKLSILGIFFLFYINSPLNRASSFLRNLTKTLLENFSSLLNQKPGRLLLLISLFFFILLRKLLGLFPFAFGWTSHILVILQIRTYIWIRINISSFFFNFVKYTRHLTPQRVPLLLGLFLANIELIRNLIRPLTLSLRLGIKITTGHILLALIRVIGVSSGFFMVLILVLATFYYFFEVFIMFIQAIVFSLLLSQYFEET